MSLSDEPRYAFSARVHHLRVLGRAPFAPDSFAIEGTLITQGSQQGLDHALRGRLAEQLTWQRPGGGMFLWARLTDGGDASQLLDRALEQKLAFVPGGEFHAEGEGRDTLRLNFSHCAEERLEEGVARLGRALAAWGS